MEETVTCPACGTANAPGSTTCVACGRPLPAQAPAGWQAVQGQPSPAPGAEIPQSYPPPSGRSTGPLPDYVPQQQQAWPGAPPAQAAAQPAASPEPPGQYPAQYPPQTQQPQQPQQSYMEAPPSPYGGQWSQQQYPPQYAQPQQKRRLPAWIWLVGGGVVVVLVAIVVLVLVLALGSGGGTGTAKSTASTFFNRLVAKDYQGAYDLLSPESRSSVQDLKTSWESVPAQTGGVVVTSAETLSGNEGTDNADVSVRLHYSNGNRATIPVSLTKTSGKWVITSIGTATPEK